MKKTCKTCGKPHTARGCCDYHYALYRAQIARRETTWEELVKEGLASEKDTRSCREWLGHTIRVRCRICETDYESLRQCATGCGYSPAAVSLAMRRQAPMPDGHDWVKLGEND